MEIHDRFHREKGFTLIEILASIVILTIISLGFLALFTYASKSNSESEKVNAIAVPAIGSIIDRAVEGAQEAEAELIENAARLALIAVQVDGEESNWVFNGGDQPNITVQELLDNGYLETDVRQVVLLRMLMELLLPLYMTNRL